MHDVDVFFIPPTLGECADLYYETIQQRLALNRHIASLKARESRLREYLQATLPGEGATGVQGRHARVSIAEEEVPTLEDRDAFRAYLESSGRWELANALRPSIEAVREAWEEGEKIPGLGVFSRVKLSVNKV